MMMMIEVSVLIGGLLGLRYRVGVLLGATIVLALAAFAYSRLSGEGLGTGFGLALFSAVAAQLAYLVSGLAVSAFDLLPQRLGYTGHAAHLLLRGYWPPSAARQVSALTVMRRRSAAASGRIWSERKPR